MRYACLVGFVVVLWAFAGPKHTVVEVAPAPRLVGLTFGDASTRDTLEQSALGLLLKSNNLHVPTSNSEWLQTMGKHSDPRSVWVPFSANPKKTSFCEPRLLMAAFGPPQKMNGLDLSGNLYVATITRKDGTRDLEFISKNRVTNEFDFGVIENFGQPGKEKIQLADKSKCMICHRSGGPFFSDTPWSQSVLNPAMVRVMSEKLVECQGEKFKPFRDEILRLVEESGKVSKDPKQQASHFERSLQGSKILRDVRLDGVPLIQIRPDPALPEEPVVQLDGIISKTNRSRRLFALIGALRDEKDRTKARQMVADVAARAILGDEDGAKTGTTKLKAFLAAAKFNEGTLRSLLPFRMRDFNQAFPGGTRFFGEGIGEIDEVASDALRPSTLKAIRDHDALRVAETYSAPKNLQASHESAFSDKPLTIAEGIESLDLDVLTFAVGIHERDVKAFAPLVDELAAKVGRPKAIEALVSAAPFLAAAKRGSNPQRDELVDGLYDAAVAVGEQHKVSLKRPARASFVPGVTATSFPGGASLPGTARILATDRCVTCHRTIGKPLRFSPDDVDGWKQWLGSDDARTAAAARRWLAKTIEALDDKTMPPDDSTEFKGFEPERVKLLQTLRELAPTPMREMPK